ncbi:hypothetical protein RclHR1_20510003 [Rhizophagus clarus]|uniref:Uncharacterized protein n=1 Tax=Rhizophagus clarus TaxID=94130 RepID=A0A2Z6R4S7_9GLOM|nr:hypothetical protein RclHR1_20510003 [Rhizophagus clarus]
MNIDQPDVPNSSAAQDSLHVTSPSRPLNPLLPDFVPSTSQVVPAYTPSLAVITPSALTPSPQHANAEIQAINEKHSAIESKMDMLQSSSAWSKVNILNIQRNRSKSNEKRNRSVSFSSALRTPPFSTAHNKPPSLSQQEASEILSLLKALQQDMADVRDHITALELNDQRMTRIERHIGL